MSTVSLIIPCYNSVATLERAVASGLTQKELLELVIVDDCSTDNTLEIARQKQRHDDRIQIIQTKRNAGPGAARNLGVMKAKGEYVCFLDHDDELLGNDFFPSALNMMAENPGTRAVKCEAEFFDPVKGYILPSYDPRYQSIMISVPWGMVIARDIVQNICFPESEVFRGPFAGEDVAFMQAVMTHFQPIGRLQKTCYRQWSQAGSHLDRFLANTRISETGFEFLNASQDQQKMADDLENAIQGFLNEVRIRMSFQENSTDLIYRSNL